MAVKLDDIKDARERLDGVSVRTPLLNDRRLENQLGREVLLKAECVQRSGSFKIRGAYNKISQLSEEQRSRGVIAASAGNHAQGVALAASLCGAESTIVLPEFAPLTKINATKGFGGNVVLKGHSFDEAVAYSKELQKESGATYVHAFEDEDIIRGQGTIGLEISEEIETLSTVVVPIGGGGIISGIAVAVKELNPNVRVIGVEAENIAVVAKSLDVGEAAEVPFKPTIADGIAIKKAGLIPLEIIRNYVDEVVTVSEEEIAQGIFHCVQNNHLVVEGAGAAGVAALLAGKVDIRDEGAVCAVLCGGNIDANLLARVLEQVLVENGRYLLLQVLVDDRPGNLSGLLERVAELGASVIDVHHKRAMYLAPFGRVGIELLLEVRDDEHGQEVVKHIESNGYQIKKTEKRNW